MKQLIIAVRVSKGHDYCTLVKEEEALQVLRCMNEIGISARLEYDDSPFEWIVPDHFDWVVFIREYLKRQKAL